MTTRTKAAGPDYASSTLPRHLVRGVLGFGGLIGSVALLPVTGPLSLLLLPAGVLALRGCPMCWTIGLIQTISRGRLQRTCENGACSLNIADRGHADRGAGGRGLADRGPDARPAEPASRWRGPALEVRYVPSLTQASPTRVTRL